MEISHSTRSGQNKSNEDRYRIREEKAGTVIVLADGMGGRSNGATAAAIVSDIICDHNWNFSNIQVSCNNAFAQADKAIAKKSEELRTKMGCAVGCLVIVKIRSSIQDSETFDYTPRQRLASNFLCQKMMSLLERMDKHI